MEKKYVKNERVSTRLIGSFLGECPSCGELVSFRKQNKPVRFCQYCGQEILWKNNDEEQAEEARNVIRRPDIPWRNRDCVCCKYYDHIPATEPCYSCGILQKNFEPKE